MNRKSNNLQHHFMARESNIYRSLRHPIPSYFLFHEKNFYKSITPCQTMLSVYRPNLYYGKFSPDGKFLITFALNRKAVMLYQYRGIGNLDRLPPSQREIIRETGDNTHKEILDKVFDHLFKLKHVRSLSPARYPRGLVFNTEFYLFFDGGNYLLLAAMQAVSFAKYPPIYTAERHYDTYLTLYNIIFYVINMRTNDNTDTIRMDNDYVVLANKHSVCIFGSTLAILSTLRQCIEIFNFDPVEGSLTRTHVVKLRRFRQLSLNIKFLMKTRVLMTSKFQFLDENHLLIHYDRRQPHAPLNLLNDKRFNYKIYVVYNITTQTDEYFFSGSSIEAKEISENWFENYQNARPLLVPWHSSSPSTNAYFCKTLERENPQNYSTSPYLDYDLFFYNELLITSLETKKLDCILPPIFLDGDKVQLKFILHSIIPPMEQFRNMRTHVTYIFHPYEPFVISVVQYGFSVEFNFHLYNSKVRVQGIF